jgi:hypothetical protein
VLTVSTRLATGLNFPIIHNSGPNIKRFLLLSSAFWDSLAETIDRGTRCLEAEMKQKSGSEFKLSKQSGKSVSLMILANSNRRSNTNFEL